MSAEKLAERIRPINTLRYDVIVVGCGEWGLAVLKMLADMGLRVLGIERKEICHNLRHHMHRMVKHSRLSYMVLDPDDAILAQKGETHYPLIEELIQSYSDFAVKFDLPIRTHYELIDIEGTRDNFALTVSDPEDRTVRLGAKRVVLATGSFDNPNLAVIPGELDEPVHHYFHEWEEIRGKKILFLGGDFPSADGIIALCQRNSILWIVRKSNDEVDQMLTGQKTVRGQPEARLANKEVLTESQVLSLENNTAVVQTPCGQKSCRYDLHLLHAHRPPAGPGAVRTAAQRQPGLR